MFLAKVVRVLFKQTTNSSKPRDKLVTSMSGENLDLVSNSEEACVVCCRSRAIMQVSPCGHQCLCRLCFVQNIKEAVASRNLPLRCLICNAKIARVKNNRTPDHPEQSIPVHVRGRTTNIMTRSTPGEIIPRRLPTSVSGYSLCPTTPSGGEEGGTNAAPPPPPTGTHRRAPNGMPFSQSSYSMSSGFSSVSSSSFDSQRSVRSNGSGMSQRSVFSTANNPNGSWFSIGSLSHFHSAGGFLDSQLMNRVPRAHSLSSRGKSRSKQQQLTPSPSSNSIRSWTSDHSEHAFGGRLYKDPLLSKSESVQLSNADSSKLRSSMSMHDVPLSPDTIDERIRAIQGTLAARSHVKADTGQTSDSRGASEDNEQQNNEDNQRLKNQSQRDSFRKTTNTKGLSLNIDQCLKGQFRRLSGSSSKDLVGRARYIKSPEMIETSFSMSTIEEEEQENIAISLKNLNKIQEGGSQNN